MADKEQIDKLIRKLSERIGASEEDIRGAVNSSDYSRLLSGLDATRAQKLESVLSDESKARALLDSPQARAVLKRLMG